MAFADESEGRAVMNLSNVKFFVVKAMLRSFGTFI
jgi:hypothetical protein